MDDASTFYMDFPIWTIVIASLQKESGPPDSVAILKVIGYGAIVPLFTDGDLADRFLRGSNQPEWETHEIADAEQLASMLRSLAGDGATDVAFDAPPFGGSARGGAFYPIAHVIEQAEAIGPS